MTHYEMNEAFNKLILGDGRFEPVSKRDWRIFEAAYKAGAANERKRVIEEYEKKRCETCKHNSANNICVEIPHFICTNWQLADSEGA